MGPRIGSLEALHARATAEVLVGAVRQSVVTTTLPQETRASAAVKQHGCFTMSAEIYPPYPPTLTQSERDHILTNIKDWSIAHGLAVRPAESYVSRDVDPAGALATTAPVTLFPSLFPRRCFGQARAVSKAYNELYSAISVDEGWLGEIVKE